MKSSDFLDAVRARHGLPSDNQAAKFLGIAQNRISMYRTGKREFSDETAQIVAAALDEEPGYIMAAIAAERAKCTAVRDAWQRLAELARHSSPLAVWVSVVGLILAAGAREAAAVALWLLCRIGRRFGRTARRRPLAAPGGAS